MYDGIKKALGPALNKTAPLRSSTGEVITDRGHRMERWVEHYSNIYSRENIVCASALDAVECLPTMEELDIELTLEGAQQGHGQLGLWQGPWQRRDPPPPPPPPPDLLRHCKTTLLHSLYVLLCRCWQEGAVPQGHAGRQDHQHSSRTRESGVTATITEASPFSASLAKSLQK